MDADERRGGMAHTKTQIHRERWGLKVLRLTGRMGRRFCIYLCLSVFICDCFSQVHAQSAYSPGQIIIKFRNAKPTLAHFRDLSERHGVIAVEPLFTHRRAKTIYPHPMAGVYRVRLSGDPVEAAGDYALRPDVVYAQPNFLFTHHQVPNDPRYGDQSGLQTLGWEALYRSIGPVKKQIIVAIIDSGVDYNHEDLRDNIWHNAAEVSGVPGADDDDNGYVDDVRGWDFTHAPGVPGLGDYLDRDNDPQDESSHGTHAAGIVAAVRNNNAGIVGIAPDAQIMALRAGLSRLEGGGFLEEDDLAAAILYAVENGAHVINMSWGGPERTFFLGDAIQYAHAQGVVLVASAGNSGDEMGYPAGNHHTIAVGATDHTDYRADFSSTGAALDLVAPGVSVFSTRRNNSYARRSGTSFSAPHISGLAALILSRRPDLSPQSVRGLLIASAIDLGAPGHDNDYGGGRVSGERLAARLGAFDSLTVAIDSPANDEGEDTAFDIRASVSGVQVAGYRLSYGMGRDPQTWTRLAEGLPSGDIRHTWDVSEFADSDAVLRLEADLSDGAVVEDRVRVVIQKTAPLIMGLVCGDVLAGDRRVFECRWRTDQRAHGGIAYRSGAVFDTLFTGLVQDKHRVVLPHTLPAGAVTFHILADGENDIRTVHPAQTVDYVPFRVPQNGFAEVGTLPDGFLPDRASDFDRDGKLEIALMPYLRGGSYGPVHVYERQADGTFTDEFQSDVRFLPWAVGDITNDGTDDLLGVTYERLMLFTDTFSNPYPTQLEFEQRGTWGGDFADVDGDSIPDIIARAGDQRGIRVIRNLGSVIREEAFLADPSEGSGDLGPRFVVADFDRDEQREILAGDADGDLWMYEYRAGRYVQTWLLPGDGDARWVGGGMDLDNDGVVEFAVARAYTDAYEVSNGFWVLEIYSMRADDTYAREWTTRIHGVATTGNGISAGDVDGDGIADLLICLRPDLYALRAEKPDHYRPIWHTPVGLMYRAMIADLDSDFRNEVLFNLDGAVHIVERDAPPVAMGSPQIIRARSLGPTRVEIDWMEVPDAASYQIYRAVGDAALDYFDEVSDRTVYIDSLLTEGETYRYQIVAVADYDLRSDIVSLVPNRAPEVVRSEILSDNQIQIFFSEAMDADAARPSSYLLSGIGQPTSVILDQQNTRAVLSFAVPFPVRYTLTILNISDASGTPLALTTIADAVDPALLARADADGSGVVDFADFLAFVRAFQTSDPTFDFDGDGIVSFPDFLIFVNLFGRGV